MNNSDFSAPAARAAQRPDTRLLSLHTERGDALSRLEGALADLEGADWGILLAGEAALAGQLRALLGAGVLRIDPRLPLRRDVLAEAGLAAAGLEGDWQSALAVWLLEPGEEDLQRAKRAGVPVIVDATLAPGAHWLAAGAQWVTYHHGATLTGFAEGELALLFGTGERPTPAAPAAPDLTAALALRDVATLPLRLARAAQTAAALEVSLPGRALPLGPTAVLLPPEAAQPTTAPLGGVLPAARAVQGGMIVTPGLADVRQVRTLLRGSTGEAANAVSPDSAQFSAGSVQPDRTQPQREERRERIPRESREGREERTGRQERTERPEREERRLERSEQEQRQPQSQTQQERRPERVQRREERRFERFRSEEVRGSQTSQRESEPRTEQPQPEPAPTMQPAADLERFVFEAPTPVSDAPAPEAPAKTLTDASVLPKSQFLEPQFLEPQEARKVQPEETQSQERLTPDLPIGPDASGKTDPAADLTDEQNAIFARLREWRDTEARRQEVSRFIVASNATLAEIARQVPYTVEDLQSIKGMGPARLSKYGAAIVQVVRGRKG